MSCATVASLSHRFGRDLVYVNSPDGLGACDMKLLALLALIVLTNIGLLLRGEGPLVWSTATGDRWNRSCRYYYPVRTFEVVLPLSQDCPRWMSPR